MVNLNTIIQHLYPAAEPLRDYLVRDDSDGEGPHIAEWHLPDPQPTPAELEAASEAAMLQHVEKVKIKAAETTIQTHLDQAAFANGYDNILTASSYAALPEGVPFQAEGAAFNIWRAQCWARAYQLLAEVKAGDREELIGTALIAELPALELP